MEAEKYSFAVDVWSLGIIFLEAMLGVRINELLPGRKPPCDREGFPDEAMLGKISDGTMRQLIKNMLNKNPSARCSIDEVVQALGGAKSSSLKKKVEP